MQRVVLVVAVGLAGCLRPVAYPCEDNAQCVKAGAPGGTCEDQGYCSFPDETCDSMRRFSELAPPSLAGECVAGEETTGATSTSSSSTTIDPLESSTSSSSSISSSSGEPGTTDPIATDGSTSSTGTTGGPTLPDPIGWWPLDETEGNTATDLGTAAADGTLAGGPQWTDGHIGGALAFDGMDDRVTIERRAAHDLVDFTIALWVYVDGASQFSHPSLLDNGQNCRMRLAGMTTTPAIAFHDPESDQDNEQGTVLCNGEDDLVPQQWHHVAGAYSLADRTLRLWVDGALACTVTTTGGDGIPSLDNDSLRMGYWNATNDAYLHGRLDDVRLYDVALGQAQIEALAAM